MKCSFKACDGCYEKREVTHTVRSDGEITVIEGVPADICDVCGDVLFHPDTIRHIEALLSGTGRRDPSRRVPLIKYA